MPYYVEVNNKKYKINTDFRVAIKCNQIAMDETIGNLERTYAIIYLLFGDKGLTDAQKNNNMLENLINIAIKYLNCGKDIESNNCKIDMDFVEDMDYIEASFMSDYRIDLANEKMHWWKFYKLINGLSNSELGNCCVLNRIRNLRNFDTSKIIDIDERAKTNKAKQQVALHKQEHEVHLTKEQQESVDEFYKALGY